MNTKTCRVTLILACSCLTVAPSLHAGPRESGHTQAELRADNRIAPAMVADGIHALRSFTTSQELNFKTLAPLDPALLNPDKTDQTYLFVKEVLSLAKQLVTEAKEKRGLLGQRDANSKVQIEVLANKLAYYRDILGFCLVVGEPALKYDLENEARNYQTSLPKNLQKQIHARMYAMARALLFTPSDLTIINNRSVIYTAARNQLKRERWPVLAKGNALVEARNNFVVPSPDDTYKLWQALRPERASYRFMDDLDRLLQLLIAPIVAFLVTLAGITQVKGDASAVMAAIIGIAAAALSFYAFLAYWKKRALPRLIFSNASADAAESRLGIPVSVGRVPRNEEEGASAKIFYNRALEMQRSHQKGPADPN